VQKKSINMKLRNLLITEDNIKGNGWLYHGIGWGVFMFFLMAIVVPYLQEGSIECNRLVKQFIIWMMGGLLVGIITKYIFLIFGDKKTDHIGH